MAALVFLMKFIQYRYLIRDLSIEFYIGLIAILFTAIGLWVGLRLTQKKVSLQSPLGPIQTDLKMELIQVK